MPAHALAGRRVLIVEDELLISLEIESVVEDHGGIVVGPFSELTEALEAASAGGVDVALLDVNLAGERSYPIAEALSQQHVPFIFITGYGAQGMPANHPEWRWHSKPLRYTELMAQLEEIL